MTALAFTSRTDAQIVLALTAGGGETQFEVEANRQPDFSSDDSLVKTGLAAGAVTFTGLPAETPFWFRGRSTNGGVKGPWSLLLLQATAVPAAPAAYTGYSIEPAILVVPEALSQMQCAAADAGSTADNLNNDDPLSVLRSSSGSLSIIFNTGGVPLDVIALLGTMANDGATWRIRCASSQANLTASPTMDTGTVALRVSTGIGRRPSYHAYRRLSASRTDAWWQIDIVHTAPQFIARHLVVGLARQSVNYSRGAGAVPMDLGQMARTTFGAPDRTPGWRGRQVDFALSWLSETEYETKWSRLDQLVGTTFPVLALPNPKANLYLNDRIAYGHITGMRGENVRDAKWSKSLDIASLY
ncbi:MAG: hypothetical protein V4696_03760 [Pseudomonadota bacterium]